jgi:hypothetical protein
MTILYALDLTELPGTRSGAEGRPALPADGFRSPLGYWFAPAESWGTSRPARSVEVVEAEVLEPEFPRAEKSGASEAARSSVYRARLDIPARHFRREGSSTSLTLEVDAQTARVAVEAGAWSSLSGPILLAVAQCWRFVAVDRTLNNITAWAHTDLAQGRGGLIHPILPRRSRRLKSRLREFHALLLDLPEFEGPLTSPRSYLPTDRAARLYLALASRLGLGRWRRLIDERVEVVEAVLNTLAESLNHSQSLIIHVSVELIIVALLLADVALYCLG